MNERFSDRARAAIARSRDEAVQLGHDAIGAEHLLLGLLHVGGPPVRVLRALGVNAQQLRRALAEAAPPTGDPRELQHLDLALTAEAEEALAWAEREAAELGPPPVAAEWVLLGVLADAAGTAARVLGDEFGVDAEAVRAEVVRLHGLAEGGHGGTPSEEEVRARAGQATRRLSIIFDEDASEEDVAALLVALSDLYRALGGEGLVILDSGVRSWDVEGRAP